TDGSVSNTLVIANCEIVKHRVAAAEHISHFNEEARSPYVKKFKTIIHPGEVNHIKELPQNNNIVLIWDVESQPNHHAVLAAIESRPDLSRRWGQQLEQATYKNHQRLYLSEQTDGSIPNTLLIANFEIVKPRVAAAEHISQFNVEAHSPFVKKFKTIIHPGEVNRIRELP
ncbi:WD40 repeat-containing protein MSI4-like protein, partial [Tanacetum coccineum]